MKDLHGIAASKGIVIAKAFLLEELNLDFAIKKVDDLNKEIEDYQEAVVKSLMQLKEIKKIAQQKLGDDEAEVFEAHQTILQDPELEAKIMEKIKQKIDAPTAIKQVTDEFINIFEMMNDEYFKARAADIKDVRKRLIANVLNVSLPSLMEIKEEVIIVAQDLTPSETSQLNKNYTKGFITNIGGRTSHAAIMARSMEIPAIVGTKTAMQDINNGDQVIMDAISGNVIVNPSKEQLKIAQQKLAEYQKELKMLKKFKKKKTYSKDQYHVELAANIGTPNDLDGVIDNGAEAIGLYRTEFLYMNSKELPDEETQFQAYKKVVETMDGKPVVVRTLDIGGDKELPYLKFEEEMNPFLGYRAIRMCLDKPEIFKVQLRALLRASAYGNLKIMFPMVSTLDEFREAKKMLLAEKTNLISDNVAVSDNIEIGIMVEIPSTAMMADTFAKEVDFFSIGTNDLIQYTMACDRMNEQISYLYQPYNPAILRMVKNVVDAANSNGKWAGMCGEMASDPVAIIILLGLGLHEFSMSPSAILAARMQIAGLKKSELEKHVDYILDLSTANQVEEYVKTKLLKK